MQKLQLSIPEPCHENWQQMTPTEQGRFCNACAKEVIDFSTMTDIQVLNYFSALTHEKVCGRALPEQLNRPISRPDIPKKRVFWYWNYIVMFFMLFGKSNAAKAQGSIKAITEVRPSKHNDINNALAGRVGRVSTQTGSLVITGKVTDIDGNPVSFASVKIKGTNTGVSADMNGCFSIKVNSTGILQISAASFKTLEIPITSQKELKVVLEPGNFILSGDIVITSYMGTTSLINSKNQIAILKVKDEETTKALNEAAIIIVKNESNNPDTAFTDKKGNYKIKGITERDSYHVKIEAKGYEPNEFTIDASDIKDRKKEWEVLLRKQKFETVRSAATPKPATETSIRMGGISSINVDIKPLYIVDGVIMPGGADINPDDIEDISILQGPAATALFGSDGANGAIVIATKKIKEKTLDTVNISASSFRRKISCGIMTSFIKESDNLLNDLRTKENELLIYPNPIHRGEQFNLALKLKQSGQYQIQMTDATGRIVIQKQINANTKDLTEKITADARWSSGMYYISIFDKHNKLINKRGFIVR